MRAARPEPRNHPAPLVVDPERAERPPRQVARERVHAHVGERLVRRGAQVDGRGAAAGGRGPAGAEELVAGRDQVVGAGPGPLGVEHQHVGVGRHQVDEQLHLVDQRGSQRLHPLHRDAGGDLVGQLDQCGVGLAELPGPSADVVGQQQLTAGRCPEPLDLLQRALVGHREGADLLDLVAPELHAQGVFLGRREDVDDASADGELATLLDQVDARVGGVGQAAYDVVERRLVTRRELDGLEVAEPLHLGLENGADRGDHDVEGTGLGRLTWMADAAEHRQPAPDGVAARAQALVGQRLPARVVADAGRVDQVGQLGDEVLGLAAGRRDCEHGAPRLDQTRDHERAQRLGAGQVERADQPRLGVAHRLVKSRVGQDATEERGKAHGKTPGVGQHLCPRSGSTGGAAATLGEPSDRPSTPD